MSGLDGTEEVTIQVRLDGAETGWEGTFKFPSTRWTLIAGLRIVSPAPIGTHTVSIWGKVSQGGTATWANPRITASLLQQ